MHPLAHHASEQEQRSQRLLTGVVGQGSHGQLVWQ